MRYHSAMSARELHDGRHDGLVPLESLDLDAVTSFASLLRAMSRTAFSGRSLGEALDVTLAMVRDPDCKVVLTLSGAMTIAKMGRVISKMIDAGMVQAIVSTGALMAHGMSEAVGLTHYRHDPTMSDEELFEKGYNRVYDTLEMESNLNYVEEFTSKALDRVPIDADLSSEMLTRTLGQVLAEDPHASGVLRSAYLQERACVRPGVHRLGTRPRPLDVGDEEGEARPASPTRCRCSSTSRATTRSSTSTASPGSRWARRRSASSPSAAASRATGRRKSGPYIDITNHRVGLELTPPRYTYAVRICPEPVHWGGLSGCTYSEGVSWGKFVPPAEGGRFAEVYADATTVWPLLIKGVLEELGR